MFVMSVWGFDVSWFWLFGIGVIFESFFGWLVLVYWYCMGIIFWVGSVDLWWVCIGFGCVGLGVGV